MATYTPFSSTHGQLLTSSKKRMFKNYFYKQFKLNTQWLFALLFISCLFGLIASIYGLNSLERC
jgi:hypothetical protein